MDDIKPKCPLCNDTGRVRGSPDIRDNSTVLCVCKRNSRVWDDSSEDSTLAVMAAGMDPDAHMNYIETQEHEFLREEDVASLQAFSASLHKLTTLEDQREQTLLQVMLSAKEVCDDAGQFMHQEATHYLVDKEYIDRLREALLAYTNANETYIGTVDGIEATPSTPEM